MGNTYNLGPRAAAASPPVDMGIEDAEQGALDLAAYWRIIRRYKFAILALGLAGVVVGALSALSKVPIYGAQTKLLVEPVQRNVSPVDQYQFQPYAWLFYETQSEIIRSRAIADRVVDKLGLAPAAQQAPPHEADQGRMPPADGSSGASAASGGSAWRRVLSRWLPALQVEETSRSRVPASMRDRRAMQVQNGVRVNGGDKSQVLVISYRSTDPKMAAKVVNAVADAYIEFGLEARSAFTTRATHWLNERLAELRKRVADSEAALQAYQAREGLVDTDNRRTLMNSKLASLTQSLTEAQTARTQLEVRLEQVRSLRAKGAYDLLLPLLDAPLLQSLKQEETGARKRVTKLGERYGDKHPKMIAARADLRAASRRRQSEADRAVQALRQEYQAAVTKEQRFRDRVEAQKSEMRGMAGKGFELTTLERELDANRQLFEAFTTRFKEVDMAAEYDVPSVRVLDRARPADAPTQPELQRKALTGGAMGLLLGVLLSFLREHLSNTFTAARDVEEKLNLPVLGVVPMLRRRRLKKDATLERFVLDDRRSNYAEAIGDIRTGVLFSNIDRPPKVIMVTSAVAAEGKTTLSSNLAISFSQLGPTLLLEGDLRKPRLSQLAAGDVRLGLTHLVAGQHRMDDCLVQDPEISNLYLLAAGVLPPNPLEFVSSERFARTLAELRKRFSHIIIDSSPVLPMSDALVIGSKVEGVVLVVRAEKTSHGAARDALKRLASARAPLLGVVLSHVDIRKAAYYGGTYYGNYHGYYGAEPAEQEDMRSTG